ncbi:hypothetical protein GGX14DRAFT_659194 [Mycena pura]|uniref:Uncharacterized protein n=1 Tax=Mycena pura TaxID=153505 RepID=A0AAD6Y9Q2_9AGAR|nr:hypothetical protein GGX14DRAFT_659194 [Mycena pura]
MKVISNLSSVLTSATSLSIKLLICLMVKSLAEGNLFLGFSTVMILILTMGRHGNTFLKITFFFRMPFSGTFKRSIQHLPFKLGLASMKSHFSSTAKVPMGINSRLLLSLLMSRMILSSQSRKGRSQEKRLASASKMPTTPPIPELPHQWSMQANGSKTGAVGDENWVRTHLPPGKLSGVDLYSSCQWPESSLFQSREVKHNGIWALPDSEKRHNALESTDAGETVHLEAFRSDLLIFIRFCPVCLGLNGHSMLLQGISVVETDLGGKKIKLFGFELATGESMSGNWSRLIDELEHIPQRVVQRWDAGSSLVTDNAEEPNL